MLTSHRFLGLVVMVAAGCASTATVESTWHAQNAPQLTNVVTISPVSDPGLRRTAEDKLAQELSRHGIHAVPAYRVIPDEVLGDRDTLIGGLRERGFDGVVTMRLVAANQKLAYYPSFNDYWAGGWGMGMGMNVVPETVVRIEVNAYSLDSRQLVFSAMSQSVDPGSANQAISDVSKVASNKIAQDRVIAPMRATMR